MKQGPTGATPLPQVSTWDCHGNFSDLVPGGACVAAGLCSRNGAQPHGRPQGPAPQSRGGDGVGGAAAVQLAACGQQTLPQRFTAAGCYRCVSLLAGGAGGEMCMSPAQHGCEGACISAAWSLAQHPNQRSGTWQL